MKKLINYTMIALLATVAVSIASPNKDMIMAKEKEAWQAFKDKKAEFPDAIALISLEKWALEQGVSVVAVSNDVGWEKFSEKTNVIKVVQKLSDAIALFQPHNQVDKIITRIREDAPSKLFMISFSISSRT